MRMYAVIFRARTGAADADYHEMVDSMRALAFERYGCRDFIAVTEGDREIAISYWDDEEAIRRWKNDPDHALAQRQGRDGWYRAYTVQVVEIRREYSFGDGG
jgi:heme-degrading monooxygenase HmoA